MDLLLGPGVSHPLTPINQHHPTQSQSSLLSNHSYTKLGSVLAIWSTWLEKGWGATIGKSGAQYIKPRYWESPSLCPTSLRRQHWFWSTQHPSVHWNSPIWHNREDLECNLSFRNPKRVWRKTCVQSWANCISYPFSPASTLTSSLYMHNWA